MPLKLEMNLSFSSKHFLFLNVSGHSPQYDFDLNFTVSSGIGSQASRGAYDSRSRVLNITPSLDDEK